MIANLFESKKSQLGFTLIELLVAVAIIVILISIGAISYTTVNRNARDSQRKSDMKKIQLALEEFHSSRGAYPDEDGDSHGALGDFDYFTCGTAGDGTSTALVDDVAFTCGSNTYMSSIPVDPTTGSGYLYEINESIDFGPSPTWCDNPNDYNPTPHGNCQKYTLWGRLENTNDPLVFDPTDPAADPLCKVAHDIEDWIDTYNLNYCVHN